MSWLYPYIDDITTVAEMIASGYSISDIEKETGIKYVYYIAICKIIKDVAGIKVSLATKAAQAVIKRQFKVVNGLYVWLDLEQRVAELNKRCKTNDQ